MNPAGMNPTPPEPFLEIPDLAIASESARLGGDGAASSQAAGYAPEPSIDQPQIQQPQIQQWIREIQALRQQVADLKNDRDQAYQAAERWQARYTTEAQQRRADSDRAKARILDLELRLARLETGPGQGPIDRPDDRGDRLDPIDPNQAWGSQQDPQRPASPPIGKDHDDLAALQERLAQFSRALQEERAAHERTRQTLTNALGDAIDAFQRHKVRPSETQTEGSLDRD